MGDHSSRVRPLLARRRRAISRARAHPAMFTMSKRSTDATEPGSRYWGYVSPQAPRRRRRPHHGSPSADRPAPTTAPTSRRHGDPSSNVRPRIAFEIRHPPQGRRALRLHPIDGDQDLLEHATANTTGTAWTPRSASTVDNTPNDDPAIRPSAAERSHGPNRRRQVPPASRVAVWTSPPLAPAPTASAGSPVPPRGGTVTEVRSAS